jgi:hypothetical protein
MRKRLSLDLVILNVSSFLLSRRHIAIGRTLLVLVVFRLGWPFVTRYRNLFDFLLLFASTRSRNSKMVRCDLLLLLLSIVPIGRPAAANLKQYCTVAVWMGRTPERYTYFSSHPCIAIKNVVRVLVRWTVAFGSPTGK